MLPVLINHGSNFHSPFDGGTVVSLVSLRDNEQRPWSDGSAWPHSLTFPLWLEKSLPVGLDSSLAARSQSVVVHPAFDFTAETFPSPPQ